MPFSRLPGRRRTTGICAHGTAGVDVKPPVAEIHLPALILRRRERRHGYVRRSVREFDVLVENDGPLLVAHDVVSVQAVAELVEVVFALRALVALGGQDRVADLAGVGRARLVDRRAQNADRIIGPGAVLVWLNF